MLFNRSVMYGLATILADGAKNQTFATLTVTRLLHTVSVLGCLGSGRITAYSEVNPILDYFRIAHKNEAAGAAAATVLAGE